MKIFLRRRIVGRNLRTRINEQTRLDLRQRLLEAIWLLLADNEPPIDCRRCRRRRRLIVVARELLFGGGDRRRRMLA